jgi:hypothetical protein
MEKIYYLSHKLYFYLGSWLNKKVLKFWGMGEIYFILPRPIAESFAINKQQVARRASKLNSF